jgi:hypothetical protein
MKPLTQKDKFEGMIVIFTVLAFLLAMLVIIGYGIWFLTLLPWPLFLSWLIKEYNEIPAVIIPLFIAVGIVGGIVSLLSKSKAA